MRSQRALCVHVGGRTWGRIPRGGRAERTPRRCQRCTGGEGRCSNEAHRRASFSHVTISSQPQSLVHAWQEPSSDGECLRPGPHVFDGCLARCQAPAAASLRCLPLLSPRRAPSSTGHRVGRWQGACAGCVFSHLSSEQCKHSFTLRHLQLHIPMPRARCLFVLASFVCVMVLLSPTRSTKNVLLLT